MLELGPETDRPNDEPTFDSQKFNQMTPDERQKLDQQIQDYDRRLKAYNLARSQRVLDPVVQRLKDLGYEPAAMPGTAYLSLKLRAEMIRQLETWPEVRMISRHTVAIPLAPHRSGSAVVLLDAV